MFNISLVTNNPAPYRERIHEVVYKYFNCNYKVIYCSEREKDRQWCFELGNYKKELLSTTSKNARHNNFNIFKALRKEKPDVIIIMGFYPTMLYAYLWSVIKRKKLIVFTDGTLISESNLSVFHYLIRKIVFQKASAFIGPSKGAADLYEGYGIEKFKFFRTYLAVDNKFFLKNRFIKKKYDLMFSGQFIDRKMPLFFVEVARLLKKKYNYLKVLMIGDGPIRAKTIDLLNEYGIEYYCPGFIDQKELPQYYSQSKLFLFPTKYDPWGVVVNEAMASGLPIITCNAAGVAHDLVLHGEVGYVLPLSESAWAEHISIILDDSIEYQRMSVNAIQHVQKYNFNNAAYGIINAINSVI